MKKTLLVITLLLIFSGSSAFSQSIGFSYFFPKNGYFGNPIAPIKFNLPLSFGDYIRITPGIGMNNIGGMAVEGLGENYQSDKPLIGPFQSLQLSLTPSIVIPIKNNKQKIVEIELMGGYFGFTTFSSKLMKGNFDEMILNTHGYEMIRSDVSIDPSFLGHGWVFGLQVDFRLSGNIWGFVAGRYYLGKQPVDISGTYQYLNEGVTGNETLNFSDTYMDYQGFEITIGGGLKKKKK